MFRTHYVAYTAQTATGFSRGIAEVTTERNKPSWRECAAQIPNFWKGVYLGTDARVSFRFSFNGEARTYDDVDLKTARFCVEFASSIDDVTDLRVTNTQGQDMTAAFDAYLTNGITVDENPRCTKCGRDASDSHLSESNMCDECPTCHRCTLVHEDVSV